MNKLYFTRVVEKTRGLFTSSPRRRWRRRWRRWRRWWGMGRLVVVVVVVMVMVVVMASRERGL